MSTKKANFSKYYRRYMRKKSSQKNPDDFIPNLGTGVAKIFRVIVNLGKGLLLGYLLLSRGGGVRRDPSKLSQLWSKTQMRGCPQIKTCLYT